MTKIFAKSPYIVEINVAGQVETKIELYLWNSGSMPSAPQYILNKLIPASNAPKTFYDLSPYVSEFIRHNALQSQPTSNAATPSTQYCNILFKKYKRIGNVFTQVGTNIEAIGFDGYGYYTDGYNPTLSDALLAQGNYYYNPISNVGWVTVFTETIVKARWTNLSTNATQLITLPSDTVRDVTRVYSGWEDVGNKLELLDSANGVIWTSYFYPKEECRYVPVQVDFVNRYGAWQREWFFTASYDTLNVENTEYNVMQSQYPNYLQTEGQRQVFNSNGKQSIKVNSDFVNESFGETIKQILLSERILVNEKAAKISTKSVDLQKHINTSLINYQLEFEFAFDIINSVV